MVPIACRLAPIVRALVGVALGLGLAAAAAPPPDWRADQQAAAAISVAAKHTTNDAELAVLGSRAGAIEARARAAAVADLQSLAAARLELRRRTPRRETAESRRDLAALGAQIATLEGQAQTAEAVATAAGDAFNEIAGARRNEFSNRVLQRFSSPLSPDFWTSLAASGAADASRLAGLAEEELGTALAAPEPGGLAGLLVGLALALVMLYPLQRSLIRLADRPASGLALSVRRLMVAVIAFAAPSLAAYAVRAGAAWGGLLSTRADAVAGSAVAAVSWGAAILALGRAIAASRSSDCRLLQIDDGEAERVRVWLWAAAVVTAAGFVITRLIYVVGASVATDAAAHALVSLAYSGVAVAVLLGLRQPQTEASGDEAGRAATRGLLSLALFAAVAGSVVAVLAGYTTMAALISGQVFWLSVLAAVTYLLLRVVDEFGTAAIAGGGWARRGLTSLFRLTPSIIGQIGVLTIAGLQILILIGALSLALTPYGQSGELLLSNLDRLGQPIGIGSARISPAAIAAGVACLALGVAIARFVRDWVAHRYVPVTSWDAGVRNSVVTGVGYLGIAAAIAAALSVMGLGFQQIALVASALSVGVGFGLQQIVQNFVAGVILLIERPFKVGDRVSVESIEGDVKRIRVRATEVQMLDSTTVIIPNSDFITKPVQNRTISRPAARIELDVFVANPADARRAIDIMLGVAQAEDAVVESPAPSAVVDSQLETGAIKLVSTLYVRESRDGSKVRNQLYLGVFEALAAQGVALVGQNGSAA